MAAERILEPFHPGELRAQELAGGGPPGFAIRDHMPDQHRSFFPLLPFLCVAVADENGWPLATLVDAAPGFVSAPTPTELVVAALPRADDPARAALAAGKQVGMLGIELPTRRRNRANGVLTRVDAHGMAAAVTQSFGNCPKYIRVRTLGPAARTAQAAQTFDGLPEPAAAMLRAAETLFVASSGGARAGKRGGIDISHRGGAAGFVRVEGDVLTIPDYPGNRYFNTLGNLVLEPRCALVLADFASGDVLQLQGEAEILWDRAPDDDPLAQRMWSMRVKRGWLRPAAFGLTEIYTPAA
ncbi:MAG TPA: pyridoxamine 5'-phosphate oxidase family protein [Telluria sp.]|nr:pyridoxamine 5'-phosphate oxidase family protein [Telluria sp.]